MLKKQYIIIVAFSLVVAQGKTVTLQPDRPSLRLQLSQVARLYCCYDASVEVVNSWFHKRFVSSGNSLVSTQQLNLSTTRHAFNEGKSNGCYTLKIMEVQFNDTGLYQCLVSSHEHKISVYTHGTYLQVYKPMEKTINISESTKNKILTAQGILLMLCVLLPSATLLCKSKKLNELEKRKMKKEEENIYEGLNLDDCCSTYDQILRTQGQNPYQDVGNVMEEEDDIQLEKP
ncbi:B-cell antigen receptor complex-associated protein alpha chain [Centroberyx affinis]|uniref:B-cell antigen receptor complex-associated protein alpha chain n=1 Tax=Centroberyx affinis TaxID=166261 RepID=UPI003A5B9F1C